MKYVIPILYILTVATMATFPIAILIIGIVKGSSVIGLDWVKWITIATGIIMFIVVYGGFYLVYKDNRRSKSAPKQMIEGSTVVLDDESDNV